MNIFTTDGSVKNKRVERDQSLNDVDAMAKNSLGNHATGEVPSGDVNE